MYETLKYVYTENKREEQPQENEEDEQVIHEHPKSNKECPMIPYKQTIYSEDEMKSRSENFFDQMNKRRSVRFFSDKDVPIEVIENCIKTAGIHKNLETQFEDLTKQVSCLSTIILKPLS